MARALINTSTELVLMGYKKGAPLINTSTELVLMSDQNSVEEKRAQCQSDGLPRRAHPFNANAAKDVSRKPKNSVEGAAVNANVANVASVEQQNSVDDGAARANARERGP